MRRRTTLRSRHLHTAVPATAVCILALLTACSTRPAKSDSAAEATPNVMTADIEAGIRDHIDAKTREGGGSFALTIRGADHKLTLVKIHTEYLASLSSGEHFACVDLVDTAGDVYDVDFFMAGDPGSMVITETIPHTVNG